MANIVAFYLPQYHPIQENNEWYGEGFTEWTNVVKAKPLFLGHYQPHIPANLGFYDLRLKETRRAQAKLAKEYGISAFCYWNYWFGGGKTLLDMPIWEVYKDVEIELPFCLGWANHTWINKMWDRKGDNNILMEQHYYGVEDYEKYFYHILPLLKDKRYFKIDGKLFFIIYSPLENDEQIPLFIKTWRELAIKEGLPEFYFIGKDSACRNKKKILSLGFNAIYDVNIFNIHHCQPLVMKAVQMFLRKICGIPTVFDYKKAIKYMITKDDLNEDVIPVIAPNWDHSPRTGRDSIILDNCRPELFYELVKNAILKVNKKENKTLIIQSWNEWGEGNHMEPDLKYGMGYLESLKKAIQENEENI